MNQDGRKNGYDLELTRAVAEEVRVPIIASGFAGNLEHSYDGFIRDKLDAALAASIFHFREFRQRRNT
jgi:cyclase